MITYTPAGPATEPLSRAEANLWLRATVGTVEDALIDSLIIAARVWCERTTDLLLASQTVVATLDCLPKALILKGPIQSVVGITVNGTPLDPDLYVVDPSSSRIVVTGDTPSVEAPIAGVTITYVGGFAVTPSPITQAMRHLVSHFYVNRDTSAPIPQVVHALLSTYKRVRL